MAEFDMEELADLAVAELRDFIATEEQLVQAEHSLKDKLDSWDYIIGHLDERIPADQPELHVLSGHVSEILVSLRDFVEQELRANISIINEEERTLQQLESARAHKEWRLVKPLAKKAIKEEQQAVRLTKQELRALHRKFIDAMKVLKRTPHLTLTQEDVAQQKEKEKAQDIVIYYYAELYKFLRAYERIIRQLWEKERVLLGEIRKKL